MQYLLNIINSENILNSIQEINGINFKDNADIINNEICIISKFDAFKKYPKRISPAIKKSFGITQSFLEDGEKIHLIIINEELCLQYNVDFTAVILHEIGHIVNEYDKKITPLKAISMNVQYKEENQRIQLENEFHADYFAKKYGYLNGMIQNLQNSLNKGFNDKELESRIEELKGKSIRITNNIRSHTI